MNNIISRYQSNQIFILTDEQTSSFPAQLGLCAYPTLTIASGESHKSIQTVMDIWNFLIAHGATRSSLLINVGGGMVTDLGGFAAATYQRGIDFMNIPTTLLAMVDAANGGKTGCNYNGLKNAIGVFRMPVHTQIEPFVLNTLPFREIMSGLAEMIKHALIADEQEWKMLLSIHPDTDFTSDDFRQRVIASIAIKDRIVLQDPTEQGIRKTLNFGHTIGHAIESLSIDNGTDLPHGYAVMYGMLAELYLSHIRMGLDAKVVSQLSHFIITNYGKINISCRQYDRLLAIMRHDKKNLRTGEINFTLLKKIGDPIINQTATDCEITEALDYLFSL